MDGTQSAPHFELPKPMPHQGEVAEVSNEKFAHITPELQVAPMPGEKLGQPPQSVAQATSVVSAISQQSVVLPTDPHVTTTSVTADDSDTIEKEWVDKAKTIVARTQGDPHAKTNQLNGLKKEYIQKRYGKVISIPADEPK